MSTLTLWRMEMTRCQMTNIQAGKMCPLLTSPLMELVWLQAALRLTSNRNSSMARSGVLILASSQHRPEKLITAYDFLIFRILLESIWSERVIC